MMQPDAEAGDELQAVRVSDETIKAPEMAQVNLPIFPETRKTSLVGTTAGSNITRYTAANVAGSVLPIMEAYQPMLDERFRTKASV